MFCGHTVHRELLQNLGCGVFKGSLCSPRGVPGRGEAPSPRLWLGRACSLGLWWALGVGRRREGRGPRPSPRGRQERRLCGVHGALRVASSPACLPSLLWRHPAPGPDPALRCRLLHSRVPYSPHPPLLRGCPLPSHLVVPWAASHSCARRAACSAGLGSPAAGGCSSFPGAGPVPVSSGLDPKLVFVVLGSF